MAVFHNHDRSFVHPLFPNISAISNASPFLNIQYISIGKSLDSDEFKRTNTYLPSCEGSLQNAMQSTLDSLAYSCLWLQMLNIFSECLFINIFLLSLNLMVRVTFSSTFSAPELVSTWYSLVLGSFRVFCLGSIHPHTDYNFRSSVKVFWRFFTFELLTRRVYFLHASGKVHSSGMVWRVWHVWHVWQVWLSEIFALSFFLRIFILPQRCHNGSEFYIPSDGQFRWSFPV